MIEMDVDLPLSDDESADEAEAWPEMDDSSEGRDYDDDYNISTQQCALALYVIKDLLFDFQNVKEVLDTSLPYMNPWFKEDRRKEPVRVDYHHFVMEYNEGTVRQFDMDQILSSEILMEHVEYDAQLALYLIFVPEDEETRKTMKLEDLNMDNIEEYQRSLFKTNMFMIMRALQTAYNFISYLPADLITYKRVQLPSVEERELITAATQHCFSNVMLTLERIIDQYIPNAPTKYVIRNLEVRQLIMKLLMEHFYLGFLTLPPENQLLHHLAMAAEILQREVVALGDSLKEPLNLTGHEKILLAIHLLASLVRFSLLLTNPRERCRSLIG